MKIGNLELGGNIFLAPLAGYTDRIFRSICLRNGADLSYTEMVSAEGISRNSENTLDLMKRGEGEKILAVQLFMPDADTASRCIENLLRFKPDLIDINCGCPVPKVTKTGAGSALMKNPKEMGRIVRCLADNTHLPVTVKMRTGWDVSSMNYLECADSVFENGASAVCMHARTKSQLYSPSAHWDCLKELKAHFPEKVIIGSGDLFSAADGVNMLKETGVDAIAFARGAIGNPFVFAQTKALLKGRVFPEISTQTKVLTIMEQLDGLSSIMGENRACREMRKHVCAYLKGIPNSNKIRNVVSTAVSREQYLEALSCLCQ